MGFFSILKSKYRRKFAITAYAKKFEQFGKPEFLKTYSRARKESIKFKYVQSNWKATGIYPRNRSKILNNRFVRNISNDMQIRSSTANSIFMPLDFDEFMSPIAINTFKSSRNANVIFQKLRGENEIFANPIVRLLFRKYGKTLNI